MPQTAADEPSENQNESDSTWDSSADELAVEELATAPANRPKHIIVKKQLSAQDDSDAKRISVYDNVTPAAQAATTVSDDDDEDDDEWAVDRDAPATLGGLSGVPLAERKLLAAACSIDSAGSSTGGGGGGGPALIGTLDKEDEEVAQQQQPEPKPKHKLISRLSIVQNPNDELMVGAAATTSAEADDISVSSASLSQQQQLQQSSSGTNKRRFATRLNSNDSDDDSSQSSFASALASRQRLARKFQKLPQTVSSSSQQSSATCTQRPGQSSLVKRLARAFEPDAAQSSQRRNSRAGSGTDNDNEPSHSRSESTWYDATSLDENELADFLADFERDDRARSTRAPTSEATITDDQYVTLADNSDADQLATASGDDDDTLNDDDDDDAGLTSSDKGKRSKTTTSVQRRTSSSGCSSMSAVGSDCASLNSARVVDATCDKTKAALLLPPDFNASLSHVIAQKVQSLPVIKHQRPASLCPPVIASKNLKAACAATQAKPSTNNNNNNKLVNDSFKNSLNALIACEHKRRLVIALNRDAGAATATTTTDQH